MRASVFAVWAAIILWPCDHWGLTLYRIGGPPPVPLKGVDIVHIAWELVETGQVAVDVFDLAGRLVRPLYRGQQRSGRHRHWWDGRRADGSPVAPGTYLYQVRVDTDEEREEHTGAIGVAY